MSSGTPRTEQPSHPDAEKDRPRTSGYVKHQRALSLDRRDVLDKSRWRTVLDSKELLAESMLQNTAFISLTQAKAVELAGEFPVPAMGTAEPSLIRAVGSHTVTAGFEISIAKNGDI